MKIKLDGYVCACCGKTNVKLWRPYMDTEPLICAPCAEELQATIEYDECIWEKEGDHYTSKPTGRRLTMEKWKVDDNGTITNNYHGPGPKEAPDIKTDQLIVDMSAVSKALSSGQTTMVPAIPTEEGFFWGYTSVPEEFCQWWRDLPTR